MRRVALLLVMLVATAATGLAGAAPAQVSVSGVTVTPEQPSPGERFTIETTVRNGPSTSASPSGSYEINTVLIRTVSGNQLARVEDVGTLPAGSDIRIPLTMAIKETGVKDLRVVVVGESGSDVVRLQYPVAVTVREGGPQLSVEADDAVVGAESTVRVTVVNGESEPVRNVRVGLAGRSATVGDATRVVPTLAAGETRTFRFNATPDGETAGVDAEVSYTTAAGNRRSTTEALELAPEPLRRDVGIDASVASGSASPPVRVDLSNFGNAPLTDVVVRATTDGRTVARRAVPDVGTETTRTARLNVSDVEAANLSIVADYETGSRAGSASTTVRYEPNPGRIRLTGVDYEFEGGRLHVTGSASNVGLSEANSVVVRTIATEGVTPTRPYKEYFVGTVPESDFVSFDLYVELADDAETIPVEVTYLVDGERRRTVQELDVSDLRSPSVPASGGGSSGGSSGGVVGGLGLPILVLGGLAALVIVGVGVYAYRRR